ncbi:MAG: efflux transporter outer membrane subunit [Bryobacteraceae bacterium]
MRALLALVSVSLLASGCGLRPKVEPPKVTVPMAPQWTAAPTVPGEHDREWWKSFGQPELDALVAEAQARNFNLEAAAARIDVAMAQARIARANYWPQLQARLAQSRQRQNFVGLPIPGVEPEQVLSRTFTIASALLEASWEPDLWGRIRAGQLRAAAGARATAADLEGAMNSVAAQTARAWFLLAEARAQLALAERTRQTFEDTVFSVRLRYEAGLRPSLDLRLALTNLAGAAALVDQRRLQVSNARRQLEVILGRYPEGALAGIDTLPPVPTPVPAGLPSELVARRPDLVAAEDRLLAASAQVTEARTFLYPSFLLTGTGGAVGDQLIDVLQGKFPAWSIAGGLLQPIFQGGRLRANIRQNEALLREATANFQNTVLQAFAEVEMALANESFLADQERQLEMAAHQAREASRVAGERYRAGLEEIITLVEAQRRALVLQGDVIAARLERLQTRVDLHLALGGSFAAPLPAAPVVVQPPGAQPRPQTTVPSTRVPGAPTLPGVTAEPIR